MNANTGNAPQFIALTRVAYVVSGLCWNLSLIFGHPNKTASPGWIYPLMGTVLILMAVFAGAQSLNGKPNPNPRSMFIASLVMLAVSALNFVRLIT